MTRLALVVAAALLGLAASAGAATRGESGAEIVHHGTLAGVVPCMACHGERLEGKPAIGAPALAGLPESRTLAALKAIAAGDRGDNFLMRRDALLLTPAQSQKVAAFLAHLAAKGKPAS